MIKLHIASLRGISKSCFSSNLMFENLTNNIRGQDEKCLKIKREFYTLNREFSLRILNNNNNKDLIVKYFNE